MKHVALSTAALLVAVGFGVATFAQDRLPPPPAPPTTAPAPPASPTAPAPPSGEMKREGGHKMDRAERKAERKAEKERRKAERKAEKEKRKAERKARKEARGKGDNGHDRKDGEKHGEDGKD